VPALPVQHGVASLAALRAQVQLPTQIRRLQEDIQSSIKPELLAKLAARKPKGRGDTKPAIKAATERSAPPQQAIPVHPVHEHIRTGVSAKPARPAPAPQLAQRQGEIPALARTRFSMCGMPVGWVDDEELRRGAHASEVAMRDPLRRDEGASPEGYTVEEAVLLLASTHPHLQRTGAFHACCTCTSVCQARVGVKRSAGARVLASLALRARPRLTELWLCGEPSASPNCGERSSMQPGSGSARAVLWPQMWAHLHHESAVAAALMQLLTRPATTDSTVRAEALSALAALVQIPWELSLLYELSWGTPQLGTALHACPEALHACLRSIPEAPVQCM
jgi:hypothetical protein